MESRERSTTSVKSILESVGVASVSDIPEASHADARGNVEIDDSFGSFSLLKQLDEAPTEPSGFNPYGIAARLGQEAVIPVALRPELGETRHASQDPTLAEHESTVIGQGQIDRSDTQPGSRMGRIKSALGRFATGLKKVDEKYFGAVIGGISKIPGTRSKQEILDFEQRHRDKYARKDSDSFLVRSYKAFRRNQYRAIAWAPTAVLGALALDQAIAWGAHSIPTRSIPVENMPFSFAAEATDIQVGGHTQGDPVNSHYIDSLRAAGLYDDTKKNVPIYWSANMAPISGDSMPMTASDMEGAAKIVDAVNDAGGAPVRIFAFSQGTEATLRAANDLAAAHGGRVPDNVTIILEGTPSGDLGVGKNPLVGTVNPILGAMGIETNQPIPPGAHIIVRTDIADVFGNGGNQGGLKLGEMAMGPGHRVVGPENGVLISRYEKDGVTYEIYGDKDGINDPFLRTLRDQGVPITPQAEALAEAALPFTPPGSNGPVYGNADDIGNKLGPAIDSYTGNTGAGTRSVDAILNDPATSQDFKNVVGLEPVIDQANDAIAHPERAPQDIQAITGEVTNAAQSGISYLQHPGKISDDANRALQANGLPPLAPDLEGLAQQPQGNANINSQVGVPMTQLPAEMAPIAQSGISILDNLAGAFAGAGRR
jgi:hypothetical protein